MRTARWKLVVTPDGASVELYVLQIDPEERINIAGARRDDVESLAALQSQWIRDRRPMTARNPARKLTEEQIEQLRGLGDLGR